MPFFLIYIAIVNIVAFFMFFIDKRKAKAGAWRIKEFSLHLISFLGGIIGATIAMFMFHHKTKKLGFCIIQVLAFIFNVVVIYFLKRYI